MKLLPLLILSACGLSANAAVFTFEFSGLNQTIPDNNPSGFADTRTLIGDGQIVSVKLTLQLDGGANGDLYASLAHEGNLTVLLNRPGRTDSMPAGYSDPGMSVTFSDAGVANIHTYRNTIFGNDTTALGGPLTADIAGEWQPDGRKVSPFSVTADSLPSASLSRQAGVNFAGDWTLFVADLDAGSFPILRGWTLEVTTVPEPTETALVCGAILLGSAVVRNRMRRKG